ncbi:MAG TPA: DUF1883 domain-containing protein [Solirubrobacteraceae bacterium]|jgi:hypothetical protein
MSDFVKFDLGHQDRGPIVRVSLDRQAAVRLLDAPNLAAYKSARGFTQYGVGWVARSPARATIPHAGHWTVVIDLEGGSGSIKAGVDVLPKAS